MFYSLPPIKRLEGGLCGGEEGITRHSFQPPRPTLVSNSARHQLPRCLNFSDGARPIGRCHHHIFSSFPHTYKHFAAPKGYAGLAEKSTHTHKQSHGTNDGGGNGRMCRRGRLTRELTVSSVGRGQSPPHSHAPIQPPTNHPTHTYSHTTPWVYYGPWAPAALPLATCLEMANGWGRGRGMTGLKGGIVDGRGCAAQIAFTEAERIFVWGDL